MPPILRIPFSLLILVLLSACSIHCKPDVNTLDQTFAPPDPAPSSAPSQETKNPLKSPEVRKALIRALAHSIEKLGDNDLEDLVTSPTPEHPKSLFVRYFTSISTNNPAPTDPFGTVPPTEAAKEETAKENIPEVILKEVDKHIQSAEFFRVPPNEVHVTSKSPPQPFTAQQEDKDLRDSLTSPTEDNGGDGNSIRQKPTTDKPPAENFRIEQHELKNVEVPSIDASVGSNLVTSNPSPLNTVDILRAPLIAAFTVHQDYLTGATRGVVPIIPPENIIPVRPPPSTETRFEGSNIPFQNDELQDLVRQITTHPASVQGRFPFLSREQVQQQELLERQRAAQRQELIRREQASFNSAPVQNFGVTSSEQQQLDQRLRKIRQLQELQHLQERLLRLQQQVQGGF